MTISRPCPSVPRVPSCLSGVVRIKSTPADFQAPDAEQSTKQAIAEREITSPHEQARLVSGAAGAGDRHMIKLPDINDGKESSEMDIWDLKNTWRMARRCAKRASSYAPAIIETCGGRRLLQGRIMAEKPQTHLTQALVQNRKLAESGRAIPQGSREIPRQKALSYN